MLDSIKAIMTELVDYAGLFPPAKLPLDTAANNFADYRTGSCAWALSRFVCPAAKLMELNDLAAATIGTDDHTNKRWPISVLGSPSADRLTFLENHLVASDCVQAVCDTTSTRLFMDALETRLPPLNSYESQSSSLSDDLLQVAQTWLAVAKAQSISQFSIFLELAAKENWQQDVDRLASVIAACNRQSATNGQGLTIGLKIRTGGVQASVIPSIEDVATFIYACKQNEVPFKATAGLHHPIRHYSSQVSAKMHGFLNVFCGAALVFASDLSIDDLQAILAQESADQFVFSNDGFSWQDHHVSVEQIVAMRKQFALSFGSCSFTEPIEDLQGMGLWPVQAKV